MNEESRKFHPSKYQQQRMDSHHTMTASPTESPFGEGTPSLRIGINPDIKQLSLEPIESDDSDHNYDDEMDYFGGGGTPKAVRKGTETVQKTLRAVWVRGHTRIGTIIQIFLILINLLAAVVFVAAVDGVCNLYTIALEHINHSVSN